MDKQFLVDQLADRLRESVAVAQQAQKAAAEEARDGATASEKRENARVAQEYSSLARGQGQRADKAIAELAALANFRPAPLPAKGPIALGAIVEVEDEALGRTFFLAPTGAGITCSDPMSGPAMDSQYVAETEWRMLKNRSALAGRSKRRLGVPMKPG